MNWLNLFRRTPEPKAIVTVRASSKKQREANETYAATHAVLASELGKPIPRHLRGYQGRGE